MPKVVFSLCVALLLWSPMARAADKWASSFQPEPLGTYLDSADGSLLVAAGGEGADGAAKALIEALRASKRARLVMDASAIGVVATEADAAIVKKAVNQPVTIVVVARVFPGAPGTPSTAVVTFYSQRSGTVLSAFSVAEGTPVSPRTSAGALPTAAMDSVHQTMKGPAALSDQEILERKAIWTGGGEMVTETTTFTDSTALYKGRSGIRIAGAELFRIVGHPEHAGTFEVRAAAKGWLAGGGLFIASVGGTTLILVGLLVPGPCTTIDSRYGSCTAHMTNWPVLGSGIGAAVAGIGMMVLGFTLPVSPMSKEDLQKAVVDYNEKTKADLKPAESTEPSKPTSSAAPWQLIPTVSPTGANLSLQVAF